MKLPNDVEKSVEDLAKNVAKHKMAASIEIMQPKKGKKKKDHDKEEEGDYDSLMTGVSDLIDDWDPETSEGKKYLKDLEKLYNGEHSEDESEEDESEEEEEY
jgi:hypothetical protein